MRLSYRNEYPDFLKHYELLHGSAFSKLRSDYHIGLLLPVGIGIMGFVGTFPHNPPFSFLIAAGVAYYLILALPYKKHFDRSMEAAVKAFPEKDIILDTQEEGLLETVDGIKSFCPWESIRHYQVFKDVLFISLASNMWAIIPSRFLTQSGSSLPDLLNVLRAHNINEKS